MTVLELLTFDNDVFSAYVLWSAVLVLKMLFMAPLTAMQRFKAKTNPEDSSPAADPNVERVRLAHRNDMENILPFFTIGLLYVFTNPNVILAVWLYRIFAIARIAHTLVYAVVVIPQPARAICFFIGLGVCVYMAVRVIIFVL